MVTKIEATLCISGDDSSDERRKRNIHLIQPYQNYQLLIVSLVIDMNIIIRSDCCKSNDSVQMTYKTNCIGI